MAEYNMQELNLPGEDGKRILYPRMKLYGQVDLETITEKIAYASSFTRGDIIGLMQAITDEIAYQMGQGYSVKIDNLGVFTPASVCGKTVNGRRAKKETPSETPSASA